MNSHFHPLWRHSCCLCICLCCVLVSAPGRAQELPSSEEPEVAEAGVIVGGAVIVVGGGAAYLLWKFCQRKFPKTPPPAPPPPTPTNNPVNPTNAAPNTVGPTYALGIDIDLGSCPEPLEPQQATTSYIAVTVGPRGSFTTSMSYGPAQSFSALQDAAAEHGLDITGHSQPPAMTINGEAGSSDVVTWLPDTRTVRVQRDGETLYRVSLEVSQDLRAWQPLARVECGEGFRVTFADAEQGSPWFYRTTSRLAD